MNLRVTPEAKRSARASTWRAEGKGSLTSGSGQRGSLSSSICHVLRTWMWCSWTIRGARLRFFCGQAEPRRRISIDLSRALRFEASLVWTYVSSDLPYQDWLEAALVSDGSFGELDDHLAALPSLGRSRGEHSQKILDRRLEMDLVIVLERLDLVLGEEDLLRTGGQGRGGGRRRVSFDATVARSDTTTLEGTYDSDLTGERGSIVQQLGSAFVCGPSSSARPAPGE